MLTFCNETVNYETALGADSQFAIDTIRQGYRYLLVMGGDGTISEVVDGVMKSGVDTTQVTVGLL